MAKDKKITHKVQMTDGKQEQRSKTCLRQYHKRV